MAEPSPERGAALAADPPAGETQDDRPQADERHHEDLVDDARPEPDPIDGLGRNSEEVAVILVDRCHLHHRAADERVDAGLHDLAAARRLVGDAREGGVVDDDGLASLRDERGVVGGLVEPGPGGLQVLDVHVGRALGDRAAHVTAGRGGRLGSRVGGDERALRAHSDTARCHSHHGTDEEWTCQSASGDDSGDGHRRQESAQREARDGPEETPAGAERRVGDLVSQACG